MDAQEKQLKYLVQAERLAEEILSERREVVLLDKQRNENREALRALAGHRRCWVTVGSVLVRSDAGAARDLLEADQLQLDVDINKLRSELKLKVNRLRDLEMRPPVPGLMLAPLSPEDTAGLTRAGLIAR